MHLTRQAQLCNNKNKKKLTVAVVSDRAYHDIMEQNYYLVEWTGQGCFMLCYDHPETGERIIVDQDIEIRSDD